MVDVITTAVLILVKALVLILQKSDHPEFQETLKANVAAIPTSSQPAASGLTAVLNQLPVGSKPPQARTD